MVHKLAGYHRKPGKPKRLFSLATFVLWALLVVVLFGNCSGIDPDIPPASVLVSGEVTLTWEKFPGATSYNVYLSRSSDVSKINTYGIQGVTLPVTFTELEPGAKYYLIVTAVTKSGESDASRELSFTVGDTPGFVDFKTIFKIPEPKSNIGKSVDGRVTLAWDNVSGANSYNVYWRTSSGVTKQNGKKLANVKNPCTIKGLKKGATYWFVVTAVNQSGESGVSNEVSTTIQ